MFDFKPILYIYTTVEFNKIFRQKKTKKKTGGFEVEKFEKHCFGRENVKWNFLK